MAGRPKSDSPKSNMILVPMTDEMKLRIDKWRVREVPPPSRAEAIRLLIEDSLSRRERAAKK